MSVVIGRTQEFHHNPNLTPQQRAHFRQFVQASTIVWQAERDGHCLCIWGLMPPTIASDVAYMWFHIVEYVEGLEFLIVRHSRRVIEEALRDYPVIVGHCQIGNDRAIRWIKWLGGVFGDYEYDFVPFRIER